MARANPQHLRPGPPKDDTDAGRAWASPRSWTNLATVLGELRADDDEGILLAVKGAVGEGIATEFFAWMHTADLHDPAEVLADPGIVDWSGERPDRLFALTTAIGAYVITRGDKATWEKGCRALVMCAKANKADVALHAVRALLHHMPHDATMPVALREAFSDLFTRTGAWVAAA